MLVTSNFSFSHNVFYSYISLVYQNVALCGNGLNQLIFWFDYRHNHENTDIAKLSNQLCKGHSRKTKIGLTKSILSYS